MLAGTIPDSVHPVTYGANLMALNKPAGDPSNCCVQCAQKIQCQERSPTCGEDIGVKLRPTQLDFGTSGGCEASINGALLHLSQASGKLPWVLLKLIIKMPLTLFGVTTFSVL